MENEIKERKEREYFIIHINYSTNKYYIYMYHRFRKFTINQAWKFINDGFDNPVLLSTYIESFGNINNRNEEEILQEINNLYFEPREEKNSLKKTVILKTLVISDDEGNDIKKVYPSEEKYDNDFNKLIEKISYEEAQEDINDSAAIQQEFLDEEIYKEILNYDKEKNKIKKYDIVVLDLETTGFDFYKDEILQVSIIDQDENVLLNEYCKPEKNNTWPEAEAVNGISPDMVKDKKPFEFYSKKIEEIINNAKLVLIYNAKFDFNFLIAKGLDLHCKVRDVMLEFAEVFGDFNEYFGNYKWQKLITAAEYYNYNFKAHDSLEDVKATLFVHKKMEELDKDKFNKHIIDTQIIPDDDGETPF